MKKRDPKKDTRSALLTKDISLLAVHFQRDYYLMTGEEMREKWAEYQYLIPEIKPLVSDEMNKQIDEGFKDHNPLYEFIKIALYNGTTYDPEVKKRVSKVDFYLHDPVHKDQVCKMVLNYLTNAPDPDKSGIALFMSRYMLKTYMMVGLAAWILTRYRVLFDEYICLRFIHDVDKSAQERGELIKQIFQYNRDFKSLYPECEIPTGTSWGSKEAWDLPGREGKGQKTVDPQIQCCGMKAIKQGAHVTIDLIDDIESERHIGSPASREETRTLFEGLKYSTKLGSSWRILAGTFYSQHGTHSAIMDLARIVDDYGNPRKPQWDVIHIPGRKEDGTLTYPKRLSERVLNHLEQEEIDKTGSNLFYCMQILLKFSSSMGSQFELTRFRRINLENPQNIEDKEFHDRIIDSTRVILVDSAWKDSMTAGRGDCTCIACVALVRDRDGRIVKVMLDAIYDDVMQLHDGCTKVLEMARINDADYIICEEPGQKTVATTLARMAAEKGYRYFHYFQKQGSSTGTGNILSVTPKAMSTLALGKMSTWKTAKMMAFQADFNSFNWRFVEQIGCLDGLIEEMQGFPNPKHDDFMDALSLLYDDRVQALLPATHSPRKKDSWHTSKVAEIPITRHTGLTSSVETKEDDYGSSRNREDLLPIYRSRHA